MVVMRGIVNRRPVAVNAEEGATSTEVMGNRKVLL